MKQRFESRNLRAFRPWPNGWVRRWESVGFGVGCEPTALMPAFTSPRAASAAIGRLRRCRLSRQGPSAPLSPGPARASRAASAAIGRLRNHGAIEQPRAARTTAGYPNHHGPPEPPRATRTTAGCSSPRGPPEPPRVQCPLHCARRSSPALRLSSPTGSAVRRARQPDRHDSTDSELRTRWSAGCLSNCDTSGYMVLEVQARHGGALIDATEALLSAGPGRPGRMVAVLPRL